MDEKKIAQLALLFLDRTPLEGRESEQMVLVRQWLREKAGVALPSAAP